MNKIFFPLTLAFAVFLLPACEQDGLTVSFDLPYSTTFTLKSADFVNTNGTPVDVTSPEVNTDASQLGDEGTNLEKLESAKLKSLDVTITAPSGQTFAFVDALSLYIKGQGKDEQLVTSATNIAATATSVTMTVEDVELVEHIKSGAFTCRASISTDGGLDNDCDMQANFTFKVKAQAL
jgi:hypothetical protein